MFPEIDDTMLSDGFPFLLPLEEDRLPRPQSQQQTMQQPPPQPPPQFQPQPQYALQLEEDGLPRPTNQQRVTQQSQRQHRQQHRPKPKRKAPESSSKANKKIKVPPLPATVEVQGHEITIPNTKTCWRVSVMYRCRHPVTEESPALKPLVVEINRHMRPCTEKCKTEPLDHVVAGLCQGCWQRRHEQENDRRELPRTGSAGDRNGIGTE